MEKFAASIYWRRCNYFVSKTYFDLRDKGDLKADNACGSIASGRAGGGIAIQAPAHLILKLLTQEAGPPCDYSLLL